jgi:hypothetical protein
VLTFGARTPPIDTPLAAVTVITGATLLTGSPASEKMDLMICVDAEKRGVIAAPLNGMARTTMCLPLSAETGV